MESVRPLLKPTDTDLVLALGIALLAAIPLALACGLSGRPATSPLGLLLVLLLVANIYALFRSTSIQTLTPELKLRRICPSW